MMGKVIQFKKAKKGPPRGPRGGVLLRVGQTWCRVHDGMEVVIRNLGDKDQRGKHRVYFSPKRSRQPWDNVAEMTFRATYMEKSVFVAFNAEVWQRFRKEAEAHGAGDGLYRLFDIPTPSELAQGMTLVESLRKQPVPKRGELWKSNRVGRSGGPTIFLIENVSRSPFGGLTIVFRMRGGFGVGPCDDFRGKRTRIGWLGEAPKEDGRV